MIRRRSGDDAHEVLTHHGLTQVLPGRGIQALAVAHLEHTGEAWDTGLRSVLGRRDHEIRFRPLCQRFGLPSIPYGIRCARLSAQAAVTAGLSTVIKSHETPTAVVPLAGGMEMSTDEFFDYLRRSHRGSGDEWGHWFCSCGASGGGTGPNSRDWRRGHNMHLRSVTRREGPNARPPGHERQ
jgi:hypothetical protein